MSDPAALLILILLGSFGGFVAGLLGVGGGIVFIPVLSYYFRKAGIADEDLVKALLANSFFAIIFSGIAGTFKQYRTGTFYPSFIIRTAIPGIIISQFITWLIQQGHWYSRKQFTIFFIAILLFLNIRLFLKRNETTVKNAVDLSPATYITAGICTGIFAALSGLGGGFIMMMIFVQFYKLNIKQASAISTGVIPLLALPLTVFYLIREPLSFPPAVSHTGYIIFPIILPIIVGVLLFTGLGVTVSKKLSPFSIKMLFLGFSAVVIGKMVYDAIN